MYSQQMPGRLSHLQGCVHLQRCFFATKVILANSLKEFHLCIYSRVKHSKFIPAQTIILSVTGPQCHSSLFRLSAHSYPTSALHETTSAARSTMKALIICLALFGGKSCWSNCQTLYI